MSAADNMWTEETLWAKAQAYFQLAHDSDRESWLYPFWGALALEHLARCALARVSPTLLADTTANDAAFGNLLFALGKPLPPGRNAKSIPVQEVLKRCEQVLPEFTSEHLKFSSGLMGQRNEELHSGGTPFAELQTQNWLPKYFEACSALLSFVEKSLDDVLDEADARAAERMIEAQRDETAKQVKKAINGFRTVWEQKTKAERGQESKKAALFAQRSEGHVVLCPACGSKALLAGEVVASSAPAAEEDAIVVRSTMLPTALECAACGLRIEGFSRLFAAGLGNTFTATKWSDPVEFYGIELVTEEDMYGYDDYNE